MLQDSGKKPLPSLDKRLKNADELQVLFKRLESDKRLVSLINSLSDLPNDSFYIANSAADVLLIHTNSASVATRLRMLTMDIKQKLKNLENRDFKDIKIQVRPMYKKKRIKHETLRKLSPENAELLRETAEHSLNPKLKSILLRLAKHERNRS